MVWLGTENHIVYRPLAQDPFLAEQRASGSFAQMRRRRGSVGLNSIGVWPLRAAHGSGRVDGSTNLPICAAITPNGAGWGILPANSVQFMRWRRVGNAAKKDGPNVAGLLAESVGLSPQQVRFLPTAFFLVNTDVPTRNPTLAASNPSLRRTNRRLSNAQSKRAQFRRCARASTKCRLDHGPDLICTIPMPLAVQSLVSYPADIEGRCGSVCDNKRWSEKTNVIGTV